MSELSDEVLSRLGLTTIGDRHRLRALCANAEKQHQSAAAAALSERMALFSRRSGSSRRGGRGGKRKLSSRRTWTVSFVCLASRHQSRIPSSAEKQVLFHAGLGMKKIKLDLEDNEQDVLEKVTCGDKGEDGEVKGFPQLKESGGFEIMYCVSGVKELNPLNYSWAAKDLKANVGSQSKLYLWPIQKNLSTVSILPQNKSQVKEKCIICSKEVLMKDLRFHVMMCKTREGLLSSESEDDDTLSISVFASEPQKIQESSTFVASVEEKQADIDPDIVDPSLTPSIPEASTLGQPENADFSSRTSTVPLAEPVLTVDEIVDKVVAYCLQHNISNPVEILRCLQKEIVTGQPLELTDVTQCSSGETNFILVNREKLLDTAFDELKFHKNYRVTLEVQFYDEVSFICCSMDIQFVLNLKESCYGIITKTLINAIFTILSSKF